jgi:uncharacterized protein with HEPN domain
MRSSSTDSALCDILRHILLAQEFVAAMDAKSFHDDVRTVFAVIRCLEIISEASRRLPEAVKARHPAIAWRQIAGAGNIYRHDYEDVTADIVWDTIAQDLPTLRKAVEQELSKSPNRN